MRPEPGARQRDEAPSTATNELSLIPLAVPNLIGNEARYLLECVDTNYVSSIGAFVERLEAKMAEAAGTVGGVATSSGTDGLHVALAALGVRRGDLVIVPSFTFVASANAVSYCGATPWLLDVSGDTWTLDPDLLERVLDEETEHVAGEVRRRPCGRRVAAVMLVHALGLPAFAQEVATVAHRRGLPMLADAAASLGARVGEKPSGALGADLSVYSFNGNKTVTAGGGGAVCGDHESVLDLVRHLSTTARTGPGYTHDRIGFNCRMTNLQAAVGCAQLEQLDMFVAAKRRIAARYREGLAGLPEVGFFPTLEGVESACWLSGITLPTERAEYIRRRLVEAGIDARPFWRPMHLQPPYRDVPASPMPVCEGLWRTVVTLPCSTGLRADEQTRVIEAIIRLSS